jgi:hypothetical protein
VQEACLLFCSDSLFNERTFTLANKPVNRSALQRIADTLTVKLEQITSFEAEKLLATTEEHEGDIRQRSIVKKTVDAYRRDMVDGNWGLSDSVIAITKDGVIINGRHRMTALAASCTTQYFFVIRNAPLDMRAHFDRGRRRTAAQQLDMVHGIDNAASKIGIFRALTEVAYVTPGLKPEITDLEIADRVRRTRFESAYNALAAIRADVPVSSSSDRARLHADIVTAAFIMAWNEDRVRTEKFYRNFLAGTFTLGHDPIKRLRENLLDRNITGGGTRRPAMLTAAYFLRAALDGKNEVLRAPDVTKERAEQTCQAISTDFLAPFGEDFFPKKVVPAAGADWI